MSDFTLRSGPRQEANGNYREFSETVDLLITLDSEMDYWMRFSMTAEPASGGDGRHRGAWGGSCCHPAYPAGDAYDSVDREHTRKIHDHSRLRGVALGLSLFIVRATMTNLFFYVFGGAVAPVIGRGLSLVHRGVDWICAAGLGLPPG